jgi:hypothetical protein
MPIKQEDVNDTFCHFMKYVQDRHSELTLRNYSGEFE